MKRVTVLAVGKIKEKFFSDGIAEYAKRLSRFCEFAIEEIPDRTGDAEVRLESDAILARLRGTVILCDIGGTSVSSEELSDRITRSLILADEVMFVIGGSRGVDERVRTKATARISFGLVTYPHQLMRLILTEQIYRAFTIANGLPYHK